jgi:hypothetical protein
VAKPCASRAPADECFPERAGRTLPTNADEQPHWLTAPTAMRYATEIEGHAERSETTGRARAEQRRALGLLSRPPLEAAVAGRDLDPSANRPTQPPSALA